MKRLIEQDYYTMLGISPNASLEEVQVAYNEALSVYSTDSIATYSLYSEEERKQILSRLLDAYKTLMDSQLRKEYNQSLIETGELSADEIDVSLQEEPAIPRGTLREVTAESLILQDKRADPQEQDIESAFSLFDDLAAVTGRDIKMIRVAKDLSLEAIYRKTNIPIKTLQNIEEEQFEKLPALVYLKGFLRLYAKILEVDQTQMTDGYVQRFLEWKSTYQK
jgi:flagellar biosynthesis protein FlhG